MTEQATIERGAQSIYEARFPDHGTRHGATPWGKQTPEVQAVWIACARAAYAALRPGDVLPGGNIVISRSQFAAIAFAKTQADAIGADQRAVNAVVRDTMAAIAALAPSSNVTRWRHVKSEREYTIVGQCRIEATGEPAYLYASDEGVVWARPCDEFLDGRFTPLPATQKGGA